MMLQQHLMTMSIDALLLLDKPAGLTSQQAVTKVKRLFNIKKAGHTGTLDPFATGLLPICLGQATKYADYFLQADKRYLATAKLGVCSTTGDCDGDLITCLNPTMPTELQVTAVLDGLLGEQQQYPPRYAAIKYQGKPLYHYARKGIQVPLKLRDIKIHQLTLIDYRDGILSLDISCSKGTYIRSLVATIGQQLGCGAYTQELRRLGVGSLASQQLWDLSSLQTIFDAQGQAGLLSTLLSIDECLTTFPVMQLGQEFQLAVQQGKVVELVQPVAPGVVKLHNEQQQFLGLGQSDGQTLRALRLMATSP